MTDDESLDGYCGADPNAARRVLEKRGPSPTLIGRIYAAIPDGEDGNATAGAACVEASPPQEFEDEDMAEVGRALMERLACDCPNYMYSNCPSEIVTDLSNKIYDLESAVREHLAVIDKFPNATRSLPQLEQSIDALRTLSHQGFVDPTK